MLTNGAMRGTTAIAALLSCPVAAAPAVPQAEGASACTPGWQPTFGPQPGAQAQVGFAQVRAMLGHDAPALSRGIDLAAVRMRVPDGLRALARSPNPEEAGHAVPALS